MTVAGLVTPALLAGALLCYPSAPQLPAPSSASRAGRADPGNPSGQRTSTVVRRSVICAAGVLAVGFLTDFWPWWVGLALAGGVGAATLRLPERQSEADRASARRELAVHADLVAACLDAGMSIGAALLAVAGPSGSGSPPGRVAPSGPLHLLEAVAALLALGADAQVAWRPAENHPDLAALASAARRSATGGAGFAGAVREHAATLRAATAEAGEKAAGRAGVSMTAPLGLCFLPAFLCLGLAPVVVGLLATLDLF